MSMVEQHHCGTIINIICAAETLITEAVRDCSDQLTDSHKEWKGVEGEGGSLSYLSACFA